MEAQNPRGKSFKDSNATYFARDSTWNQGVEDTSIGSSVKTMALIGKSEYIFDRNTACIYEYLYSFVWGLGGYMFLQDKNKDV